MAKQRKREIENYAHTGKERANNPPVGLVTPQTDRDAGAAAYAYDPRLDWPRLAAVHRTRSPPNARRHPHSALGGVPAAPMVRRHHHLTQEAVR